MPESYYYARGGKRHGPLTADQLRQLVSTGFLAPTEMVLIESQQKWFAVETIPELALPRAREATPASNIASPDSPPNAAPLVDRVFAYALVVSLLCYFLNEFLGRPLLVVAGIIWLVVGACIIVTGRAPAFSGSPRSRPIAYRVFGVGCVVVGLVTVIHTLAVR